MHPGHRVFECILESSFSVDFPASPGPPLFYRNRKPTPPTPLDFVFPANPVPVEKDIYTTSITGNPGIIHGALVYVLHGF